MPGLTLNSARRPLDAATGLLGTPNSLKPIEAIARAVKKRWTPTGTTIEDIPATPAGIQDFYKS
jgi:hypothetical protein